MSTKLIFKRIALVTISALGFGILSSVAPASALASTAIAAYVGPSNQTSLTVVGGDTTTTAALVRIDLTVDSATGTSVTTNGLSCGESITATVTNAPSGRPTNTSMVDTSTSASTNAGNNRSDLSIIEIRASTQASGTVATNNGSSTTSYTDWSDVETAAVTAVKADSSTAAHEAAGRQLMGPGATRAAALNGTYQATDAQIGCMNSFALNMDGTRQNTTNVNKVSYYAAVTPRPGADVMDKGAYTITFQLTDSNGAVVGSTTVKIDFASAPSTSGATLTLTTNGTFIKSAALATTDTSGSTNASVALKNRDGGLVRTNLGDAPTLTSRMQVSTTAIPVYTDTGSLIASDTGAAGYDFGNEGAGYSGTLKPSDGVYGLRTAGSVAGTNPSTLPHLPTIAADAARVYRFNILYGNATPITTAFTVFEASGSGLASAPATDVLVTAAGMSTADQLTKSDTDMGTTFTLPTTTTSATVKFTIQTASSAANAAGATLTVKPTWSGSYGTANVSPATSTTGTAYTTDASGNFSVTVTNTAPVSGGQVTLNLSAGDVFGAESYTATLRWQAPAAAAVAVLDPLSGVFVGTGTTNVTTVRVTDQFGAVMANQQVSVALSSASANYSSTTVIAPITTGAAGTATYSLVGGATTATADTITFACVPTACTTTASATMVYNYISTVPAVSTLAGYFNQDWNASAVSGTAWPVSGDLFQTNTSTKLVLKADFDTTKNISGYLDTTTDALVSLALYGTTSTGAFATGAVVTVTAGSGGHVLGATGIPSASRSFLIGGSGWTGNIQILATKTGDVPFTVTSGTTSKTFTLKVANAASDGRFINITGAATGTANGSGVPVTVTVTDAFGNPVPSVNLVVTASGVGSLLGGATSSSFTTDDTGSYTFLATSLVDAGGAATFTARTSTAGDYSAAAGFVSDTAVASTIAAGNSSKALNITFAAGQSATQVAAEAATDAAAEAIDAANAATDAANLAAEAADAATVAAEEARDAADAATAAVEELATQVATLMAALKAQITTLANTVAKIAKKVKA